jgi:hypothetical protein
MKSFAVGPLWGVLLLCLLGALYNDYMHLGWLGRYDRLLTSIMVLITVIFVAFAQASGNNRFRD